MSIVSFLCLTCNDGAVCETCQVEKEKSITGGFKMMEAKFISPIQKEKCLACPVCREKNYHYLGNQEMDYGVFDQDDDACCCQECDKKMSPFETVSYSTFCEECYEYLYHRDSKEDDKEDDKEEAEEDE
jgi:hypothetical protein